jgi:hypothetical protein
VHRLRPVKDAQNKRPRRGLVPPYPNAVFAQSAVLMIGRSGVVTRHVEPVPVGHDIDEDDRQKPLLFLEASEKPSWRR